jgi:hypothetical protein
MSPEQPGYLPTEHTEHTEHTEGTRGTTRGGRRAASGSLLV